MDKHNEGEDDDLMAMLEESQQDFDKRLNIAKEKCEHKEAEKEVLQKLQNTNQPDAEKPSNTDTGEQFFQGFEKFMKNIGMNAPGSEQIDQKELEQASQMFKDMFKEFNDSAKDNEVDGEAEPKENNVGNQNPLLSGYQNMSKDASSNSGSNMPDFGELFKMMQDTEFNEFFNNFSKDLFNQAEGANGPDGSNGLDSLLNEFTGFLNDNKDDPELKATFDKMMGDIVSKDSMYPPMKLMKDELPDFLEEKGETLSIKDLERYNNQLDVVEEICEKYESGNYEQEDIVNLLYKLHEHGSPPPELLEKLQKNSSFGGMPSLPGFPSFEGFGGNKPGNSSADNY